MKNSSPITWIAKQLECFERQTRSARTVRVDGTAFDLESRMSLCLRLHGMIEDVERNWGQHVRDGEIAYDVAYAEEIQALYVRWLRIAKRILPLVKRAESDGRRIVAGEALKDAIGFCYQAHMNIRQVNKYAKDLDEGKGIRITEETHGIHRRRAG